MRGPALRWASPRAEEGLRCRVSRRSVKKRGTVGWRAGKAFQPKVQASLGRWSQMHLEILVFYLNRLILAVFVFELGASELVLAEGAGLQQDVVAFHWVRIHQRQADPAGADSID